MDLGDIRLGDTFDAKFTTIDSTGLPVTLAGTPVVSAYPGNSVTELTAGITLTVDFDARTGLHNVRIVATSGNGYATATDYSMVLTAGTVSGVSVVGYVIGSFSIEKRSALMPTTAARTLDVSATGEAGIDWANIGAPTTAQNLSATNIDVDQIVASVSGAVGSVTGAVGSVTGAVGSVTANVNAVLTNGAHGGAAATLQLGGAGGLTGAVTGNLSGSVGSVTGAVGSVTGLTAATVHSDLDDIQARLPAALTAGGNIKADALAWNGLATVALPATPTNITAATGIVLSGVTHTGAVVPTVTTLTGHTAQTGDNFARLGLPAGVSVSADIAAIKAETASIQTDTNDIQTRLPAALVGGRMDSSTGANAADVITAASIATDAGAEIADAILLRKLDRTGAGTDLVNERTVVNALRAIRNKTSIAAGTLTVTKEDDTTSAWTATVSTAAGNPISGVDPT